MGWCDAVLADLIRLQAFLNERWARDGLTPEEATEATLSAQEMMLVTNTQHPRSARRRLLALPPDTTMGALRVSEVCAGRDSRVRIEWPKLAEFQCYLERDHPKPGLSSGGSLPRRSPSETRRNETRRSRGEPQPLGDALRNLGIGPTRAPERLDPGQIHSLRVWTKEHHPYYATDSELGALVAHCLREHRASGKLSMDWEAECRRSIEQQALLRRQPDLSGESGE